MQQPAFTWDGTVWRVVRDGNDTARNIFGRHYSRRVYRDGRKPLLFVGPGQKTVLLTPKADALFVWRKFISDDGQTGVSCAVFRNESVRRGSELILEAECVAWERWPGERLYTYVNPGKLSVRKCRGREYCPYPPGRCFIEAGWRQCGVTKGNLLIFEKFPSAPLLNKENAA